MHRTFHSHWIRPWILTARFDSKYQKVLKAKSFRDIISIDFSNHLIVGGSFREQLKFVIFSDFHYKNGMYASTVDHMKQILTRARETGASSATISRVNRALLYGADGYCRVLDALNAKEE